MRRIATIVAVSVLAACSSEQVSEAPPPAPPPQGPPPWSMPDVLGVDALVDENPDPNVVEVTLTAGKTTASFLDGKKAQVFAYNGSLPGPLLRAKVGDEVIVHFKNALPDPTTIHWHGLRVPDDMDGAPRVKDPVAPGKEFTYRFVVPDAGSYWYHPHVNAADQIEKGLYAPIVIFDPKRDPVYDAERFLVLDDIRVEKDGTISPENSMDGMMSGRFGNVLLTNGRPVKEATATAEQGTVERWRIVNSANARTMDIGIENASFRVIATDGGLLPEPYTTKRLLVPIGQRFDLEVTYDQPGAARLLTYVETDDSGTKSPIAAFTVDVTASDRVPREIAWPSVTLPDRAPTGTATFTFNTTDKGSMPWTINGVAEPEDPLFTWSQGSTIDIVLVNKIQIEHPFHLHGQFFQVLGDPKQPGLKDVVLMPPSSTTKIRAYIDNPGRWMTHCHILEHAEMGMMGEIKVTPDPNAPPVSAAIK